MAKLYLGVNNKPKEVKNLYIGINEQAKKVIKAYIGVNEKAKLFYSADTSGTSLLPSEYKQVEYIKSLETTNTDININVIATSSIRIVIEYLHTTLGNATSLRRFLIGTKPSNDYAAAYGIYYYYNNRIAKTLQGYCNITQTFNYIIDSNTYLNKKHILDFNNNGKVYLDKTEITKNSFNNYTSNDNIYIFDYPFYELYSCKIYNDNEIIRDLYPCFRISDNIPGLYDIVGKTFYNNTGNYEIGPEINE